MVLLMVDDCTESEISSNIFESQEISLELLVYEKLYQKLNNKKYFFQEPFWIKP